MEKDIILLLIGTILGFSSSIGTLYVQATCDKRKALSILKFELKHIKNFVEKYSNLPEDCRVISYTEIPNFKIVSQLDIILKLPENLQSIISDISYYVNMAEEIRLIMIPLLDQIESSSKLELLGRLHQDYLNGANKSVLKLEKYFN